MSKVNSVKSVDLSQISLGKFYTTSNGLIKAKVLYNNNKFLVKGPTMSLGCDPVVLSSGQLGIDLCVGETSSNKAFNCLLTQLDRFAVAKVYENPSYWDFHKAISLFEIEQCYLPTLRLSTLYDNQLSLKLNCNLDQLQLFDQDNLSIKSTLLKHKYNAVPLLYLSHICKDDRGIWLEWELLQLKVSIPEPIFDKCYLEDVNDSEPEDIID